MKKLAFIILFFAFGLFYSQKSKTYNSGTVYWGAFDTNINDFASPLEKDSQILEFKIIDNDYYLYTIKNGKKSRMKLSYINGEYVDEFGIKYLVNEKDNSYYLFCLKELPNHKGKFLVLKVTDLGYIP